VNRTPLSLLVSRQLRDAIVSGELVVGTEMPTEKELTEHFHVSRSTIREALRILQAQGLLSGGDTVSTSRPKISVEQTRSSASTALENVIRLGQVPLGDLIELRVLLEGDAVSAKAPDPAVLADARRALDAMQAPGVDVATFHEADVQFHITLAGLGGNGALPLVMAVLRDAIAGHLIEALDALDDPAPTLARLAAEHAAILDAIGRGHGTRARTLVHDHIWAFYEDEVPHELAGRPRHVAPAVAAPAR
jgi:DNA-binding FadR family transcriptional regulator